MSLLSLNSLLLISVLLEEQREISVCHSIIPLCFLQLVGLGQSVLDILVLSCGAAVVCFSLSFD